MQRWDRDQAPGAAELKQLVNKFLMFSVITGGWKNHVYSLECLKQNSKKKYAERWENRWLKRENDVSENWNILYMYSMREEKVGGQEWRSQTYVITKLCHLWNNKTYAGLSFFFFSYAVPTMLLKGKKLCSEVAWCLF